MNGKSLKAAVLVALVALFASVFSVFAYPAEQPDRPDLCQTARAALSSMDIPSRMADYKLLERVDQCATGDLVTNLVIPVTGAHNNKFMQFKERQAELASGGEKYTSRSSKTMPFAEFKDLQAEQRSN